MNKKVNKKMKPTILFLISNFKEVNTGKGGHYYSFLTTLKALKRSNHQYEFKGISIGDFVPSALVNQNLGHVFTSLPNYEVAVRKILEQCKGQNVVLIHAFDYFAAEFARRISNVLKVKYITTKAGGAQFKRDIPLGENLVVYHKKDEQYYRSINFNAPKNVHLINARASKPEFCEDVPFIFGNNRTAFKIIRVCRIGAKYQESIQQAIHLVEFLNKRGLFAQLVIVGHVEDKEVLKSFAYNPLYTSFKTTERFTRNASRFIVRADAVVGVGRSVQEAFALGKIVFSPVKGEKYPQLLSETNLEVFSDNNFSMRIEKADLNVFQNIEEIYSVLSNKVSVKKLKLWTEETFYSHFDISIAINKLNDIYEHLISEKFERRYVFDLYSAFWHKMFLERKKLGKVLKKYV